MNLVEENIDLEAYFQRIGYKGERAPSLKALQSIHALHPQAIAFENLNPLLRIAVQLDLHSIQQKLVKGGRGGYCFEHNLLLSHALQALGFSVKNLAARVRWNIAEGTTIARSHMLLLVKLEEQAYIADVGFGGQTLTAPLLLLPDLEQETSHGIFRLIQDGEEYILQAKIREEWKSLYSFGLQEYLLADYEMASWYLSNHPDSHFINGLIAAIVTPDGRYTLRNNELGMHDLQTGTDRQVITKVEELQKTLWEIFRINLPDVPDLTPVLEKLIKS